MRIILTFSLVFLASTCILGTDVCTTLLDLTSCQSNKSCSWTKTNNVTCIQKQDCKMNTQAQCMDPSLQTTCLWKESTLSQCSPNDSTCQEPTNNICANPTNCNFQDSIPASCSPVGINFGCSKITDPKLCTDKQCTWQQQYCQSTNSCKNLNSPDCNTNSTSCSNIISSCKVDPSATAICSAIIPELDCINQGCSYVNFSCQAPTRCPVNTTNNTCPNQCLPDITTCQEKTGNCLFTTEAQCSNNNFCSWNTNSPVCMDVSNYCSNPADCQSKSPFCTFRDTTKQKCIPNQTLVNICSLLSNQTDCSSNTLCSFSAGQDATCINKELNCIQFIDQNFCQAQPPCTWTNIFSCTTTPIPSTNAFIITFGLSVLLLLLSF